MEVLEELKLSLEDRQSDIRERMELFLSNADEQNIKGLQNACEDYSAVIYKLQRVLGVSK